MTEGEGVKILENCDVIFEWPLPGLVTDVSFIIREIVGVCGH